MTIAARLREIVDDIDGHPDFLKRDGEVCKAELRALLAVARAADEVIGSKPCVCGSPLCDNNKIARALSRLARLSSPRGARRAKSRSGK